MADFFTEIFAFRSYWHLGWFLVSLTLLVVYLTISLSETADIRWRRRRRRWVAKGFAEIFGAFHLISAILAVFSTLLTIMPEAVISADCIWFNALMAVIYKIATCLEQRAAKRLRQRLNRPPENRG